MPHPIPEIIANGTVEIIARYIAPEPVNLLATSFKNSFVCSPGLTPGMNPPCLFKLSAMSLALNAIDA